jgi:hypothetical protein
MSRGCPGLGRLRLQHAFKHAFVDRMVTLEHPQRLASQPVVFWIARIQSGYPLFDGLNHGIRRPVIQLAPCPVPRARLVGAQLLQKLAFTLSGLCDWLQKRSLLMHQPIDAAVLMVAVRIALRILHVADERVAPVAEPKRAVRADLRIDRAEILVATLQ